MTSLSVLKSTPVKQAAKKKFWETIDTHLEGIIDPSPINLDELAGFFDGDGSFYMSGQQHMTCAVTQCSYKTLRKIQDVFGGIIRKRDPKKEGTHREKHRIQYTLVFRGISLVGIVPFIKDRLIRKSHVANIIMKIMSYYCETTEEAAKARRELQDKMSEQHIIPYERVNWDYIRGLFEAEGCVQPHSISIAQKDDLVLLEKIKAFVEDYFNTKPIGKVDHQCWIVHKNAALIVNMMNESDMFHQEKADQITAFIARDFGAITYFKHIEEDVADDIIKEGNDRSKELSHKIREAWHISFETYASRPAKDRQPIQFGDRPLKLTETQIQEIITLRESTSMSLKAISEKVGGTKEQITYALKKRKNLS